MVSYIISSSLFNRLFISHSAKQTQTFPIVRPYLSKNLNVLCKINFNGRYVEVEAGSDSKLSISRSDSSISWSPPPPPSPSESSSDTSKTAHSSTVPLVFAHLHSSHVQCQFNPSSLFRSYLIDIYMFRLILSVVVLCAMCWFP